MSQKIFYNINSFEYIEYLPAANVEVMPGIQWGDYSKPFTPAFWLIQFLMYKNSGYFDKLNHQTRNNFVNEFVFCLLGGYGITAEMTLAAFKSCQNAGLIKNMVSSRYEWEKILLKPLYINGKNLKYRYPIKKAEYLANSMSFLRQISIPNNSIELRNLLLKINGVGYKTAGWVVRNYMHADDIAILDIHIVRAGQLMGLYELEVNVSRKYLELENKFLNFCRALSVPASKFDFVVWSVMREFGNYPLKILNKRHLAGSQNNFIANGNTTYSTPVHSISLSA